MIKGHKDGDNITIMNTHYIYPRKDENDKWDDGNLMIIYKDNINSQKFQETIPNPNYEFYIAKENTIDMSYNHLYAKAEDVARVVCPFKEREKKIAELTGNEEFYKQNIKNGNRYQNMRLHLHPAVFMSDTNIEDHYRFRFGIHYKNDICSISKCFFDIEVDGKHMLGDFPDPGECPINAVTLIMQDQKQIYTFLLRTKENIEQINAFERSIKEEGFFDDLKSFIRYALGGEKQELKYRMNEFNYNFAFYDEEEEIRLIQDIFGVINTFQPDFAECWNMAFDVPYIMARIRVLGYNPEDIMCHKDFPVKVVKYFIDERNKNEPAERGDFATISSYTTFLDQMIHFASRRKGQSQFPSFKLDDIGDMIAGVRKLDYKHITTDLMELPYLDYKTFVFYNIMDPIVQYCIEFKTGDLEYIFAKCLSNNTRYQKGHRQTVYLANRATKEFFHDGKIIGNNANRYNEKPTSKFPGAFVSDPLKLSDKPKLKINGIPVRLCNLLDDFDFKALYPSIIGENNIAPNTQIGMVIIEDTVHDQENRMDSPTFNRGGSFIEDLVSRNWLEFGRRWFHLPDYGELVRLVSEYFSTVSFIPNRPYNYQTGLLDAFIFIPEGVNMQVFTILKDGETITTFDDDKCMRQIDTKVEEDIINGATNYPKQSYKFIM